MTDDEVKAVQCEIASAMFCVEPDDVETFVKDSDYPSVHARWKEAEKFARAAISKLDEIRGDGWRPIESAPKDGTRVMLLDGGAYIARWSDECQHGQFDTRPGWQIFECEDGFYSVAADGPTHWQPLPMAPQEKNNE